MEPTATEKAGDASLWGFNPESRRYVLRSGDTWRRLIKRGVVEDAETMRAWEARREAARSAQIAAAKQARVLGFGICGGATRVASEQGRARADKPEPPPPRAPASPREPERPQAGRKARLRALVLEHRDVLGREDLTREEAEAFLREKLRDPPRGQPTALDSSVLAPWGSRGLTAPVRRAGRWTT